jgi:hypothetical protein
MKLTDLQKEVVDQAYDRMRNKPWFSGVCLDIFGRGKSYDTDQKILEAGFENVVRDVIADTEYWDN